MTQRNEPLQSIQSRIEELQNTIASKEQAIRQRSRQLHHDIETELSPAELVRKHPFPAAGLSLAAGLLVGRTIKRAASPRKAAPRPAAPIAQPHEAVPQQASTSRAGNAAREIGLELLNAGKEMAINYLQGYIDSKLRSIRKQPPPPAG